MPDVNVLLALSWDQHVHHRAARRHFARIAADWATCAITESGLLRLLLTPAVVGRPVSGSEALGFLDRIRRLPGWNWIDDNASLATAVIDTRVLVGRRQVTDLHLADLAARHGRVLCTFDAAIATTLTPADRGHISTWSA